MDLKRVRYRSLNFELTFIYIGCFVKTENYDKRDDFDMVKLQFLDSDVPRSTSYGVYISQLIRFARVSSHVVDFNTRNKVLTAKPFRQRYRYYKIRKAFSEFYRRHFDIVSKYNVGLKHFFCKESENVLRKTACYVVNPYKVNSFAYLFNCTTVGRASD